MHALYTYNLVLAGPDQEKIDHIIEDLKRSRFVLTVHGYL